MLGGREVSVGAGTGAGAGAGVDDTGNMFKDEGPEVAAGGGGSEGWEDVWEGV